MNEKGEDVTAYSGKKWPWGLVLLYISHHSNIKLQGQQKVIYVMLGAIKTLSMNLNQFRTHMENVNLCHFSSSDLIHKDGSISVPFPSDSAVEMNDSFTENLK
jgi:hypothetical protein